MTKRELNGKKRDGWKRDRRVAKREMNGKEKWMEKREIYV